MQTEQDLSKTLLEVALEVKNCDKISHGYCDLYQKHFQSLRNKSDLKFLEIGVLRGESLHVFSKYFHPLAHIHGIDINDCSNCIPLNAHFTQMNTQDVEALKHFSQTQGLWDIIIDDGGHDMFSQQNSIQYLWSCLKPGGLFVMEDIHSSFMDQFKPQNHLYSTYNLMKCLADCNSNFSSPWMTEESFLSIRDDIEFVEFFQRDPNLWTDSITSIAKKKL